MKKSDPITMTASTADWIAGQSVAVEYNVTDAITFVSWDRESGMVDAVADGTAKAISELDAGKGRSARAALDEIRRRHFSDR